MINGGLSRLNISVGKDPRKIPNLPVESFSLNAERNFILLLSKIDMPFHIGIDVSAMSIDYVILNISTAIRYRYAVYYTVSLLWRKKYVFIFLRRFTVNNQRLITVNFEVKSDKWRC